MTVQLPGIIDIVPDAVESARNADCGRQESVSHPDCKNGVLLAEGLRSGYFATIAAAYRTAGSKLENTGKERGESRLEYDCKAIAAMHYLSGTHSNGEGKRNSPDIECEVAFTHEPGVQAWQEVAYGHTSDERKYQKRKDLI